MAFNLTRAAGALASAFCAKATTATIRAQLIKLPARVIRSAAPNAIRSTSEPALGRRLARLAHRGHRSNAPDRSLITRSTIGPIRRPHWKGRPEDSSAIPCTAFN